MGGDMRKQLIIGGALLIAVCGAGILARHFYDSGDPPPAPTPPPTATVVASEVKQGDVPIYLVGVGTVIAYNTVVVRSQITGQLTSINFTEGQKVKIGDLLGQIDPRPYQAMIDQYTAQRDRDEAQLKNAEANLSRYTQLGTKGYATPQLIDTQSAQVAQLKAAVKADAALIEQAQVQLSYTRLTSPIDGVTGIRQLDIGNVIHPTDPNGLVIVTQLEPISLIFTLPEATLPHIQQQQEKNPSTPIKVITYSQDNKIRLDEGLLGLVNNEIVQTTGSIQLKANFANKTHHLWPGQLVNARLLLETRHNALTVPAPVVQQGGPNGSYVWVIKPDNTVETRPITVAQISDGQALVDKGLQANEKVVADGQYKLKVGTHVTILSGKAAEEEAAQQAQQAPIP
jgi:membrane fusion protein, multidrug efflux system